MKLTRSQGLVLAIIVTFILLVAIFVPVGYFVYHKNHPEETPAGNETTTAPPTSTTTQKY